VGGGDGGFDVVLLGEADRDHGLAQRSATSAFLRSRGSDGLAGITDRFLCATPI
jgi:hypothetical protein